MSDRFRRAALPWFVAVVGLLLAAGARAQPEALPIKAFFGHWKGSALSESAISIYFEITKRDIDVKIAPHGDGGFTIDWATVLRQKGTPEQPEEVLKSTTMNFAPAGRANVWQSTDAANPISGKPFAWARIEKQSLFVYVLGIAANGSAELQVYERTLDPNGMLLDFKRIIDGQRVRSVRGRLIKFGN